MDSSSSLRTRLLDAVDGDDDDSGADFSMGGLNDSSVSIGGISAINRSTDSSSDDSIQSASKTIGFLDSFCLHLNNLTGPALVLLPLINQEAGWLPCTIGLFLLAFFSFLASTMLAEAIQRIPGNSSFGGKYEFVVVVRYYFGTNIGRAFELTYNLGLLATIVASCMLCLQISDILLVRIFGSSWGVSFSSGAVRGSGAHEVADM